MGLGAKKVGNQCDRQCGWYFPLYTDATKLWGLGLTNHSTCSHCKQIESYWIDLNLLSWDENTVNVQSCLKSELLLHIGCLKS